MGPPMAPSLPSDGEQCCRGGSGADLDTTQTSAMGPRYSGGQSSGTYSHESARVDITSIRETLNQTEQVSFVRDST
eukprot:3657883-Pyramimonas_sp.AAC.1